MAVSAERHWRVLSPNASGALCFSSAQGDSDVRAAPLPVSRHHKPEIGSRPDFSLFPLFFALFFHCFPLFLRRGLFSCYSNELYCISAYSRIADRLYFLSDCGVGAFTPADRASPRHARAKQSQKYE
jgi:hypothetical protein